MLTFSHKASAVDLGFFPDPHVVGTVTPDDPDDIIDEANYINFMIHLAVGDSGTFQLNTIAHLQLSGSLLGAAEAFAAVRGTTANNIDLDFGGYQYLFAKYDGQNDLSQVWWLGGLDPDAILNIPTQGPEGQALSHWTLFLGGAPIPDGGATIMLLGGALGALGMARRYVMR
jgi:hypothetical protein